MGYIAIKSWSARGFLAAAILGAFLALLSPAAALPPASPYAGKTWEATIDGSKSTIVFKAGGQWTEFWKDALHKGTWQATPDNTEVVVTRDDNNVVRYRLRDGGDLVKEWGGLVYHPPAPPNPYAAKPPSMAQPAVTASSAHQPPSDSPFAGTTWVSGDKSTIRFESDGTWTETWKDERHKGHWQTNEDNTEIFVVREDNLAYAYKLNANKNLVRSWGGIVYRRSASPTGDVAATSFGSPAPAPSPAPDHPAATVKLTEDQARAVVVIKGDNAVGTGFLVKMPEGPVVMTNIHVISNNPHLQITTNTGAPITILSYKGATDRDLAMISIKDGDFSYLTLAKDVSATVQPGDEVITPGNSEGGDVVLNTDGKVLGVGPERIEFDNPIYHGNSGGPVFHVKSGTVIGVVAAALKVDVSDELDKASFANRNSAIGHAMRYFGLRLDTARHWETYDWNRFQVETLFLDQFEARNTNLDSYLNAPDDNKPEDIAWRDDDQIVKANSGFFSRASGADTSQQMDAARQWLSDMYDLANANMDAIQDPRNFYAFDQLRAKDAIAYRKALKTELDSRGNNLSQLASMPRKN